MRNRGQTGNSKFVKQMNRDGILFKLRQKQMSRADLAKETELSRPCVSSLVEEMINEGLIHEVGVGESKGGRKPTLLAFNSQSFAVVGAVFEGSEIQMALADLKGEIFAHFHTRLNQPTNGEMAIRALEKGLAALLEQSGFEKSRLIGIGVGLPGITQRRNGTISYSPSTGWMDLPVQQEIEEKLGMPVIIENDVNMMTLGEYYQGVGKESATLVNMYVGTGIGAGILINGQLYRGSKEAAGEIGYMLVGPIGKRGRGEFGVFESNYSVPGIYEKAKAILPSLIEESSIIEQLVTVAGEGDAEAQRLLDDVYKHWASGMANVASVLDPELLILSGELVHIDDKGVQTIQEMLSAWVPVVPQIKIAALGDRAGIIGAVHSALETFSNHMARLVQS
ncbi:ROK family protein [Paenibacillus sp. MBLB4367]|uniref:ROK family transcriptional regulator n=1 Tax=Paenibacillus sp. MBLB4367 TaxID=3384767 RepID=UPI0039081E01